MAVRKLLGRTSGVDPDLRFTFVGPLKLPLALSFELVKELIGGRCGMLRIILAERIIRNILLQCKPGPNDPTWHWACLTDNYICGRRLANRNEDGLDSAIWP